MIPHDLINAAAIRKTRDKDPFYNNNSKESWQTMNTISLAEAARYKIDRAIQPGTSLEKCLDDLEDAYNFVAALYERKVKGV